MQKKAVDKAAAAAQRERLGLPAPMDEARIILEQNQQLQFDAIIESIITGSYLETAFMVAGISKKRAYEWFKYGHEGKEPYATFLTNVRKAQGLAIKNDLGIIQLAAMRGDWRASAWRLERTYPNLYGQRIEIARTDLDPDSITPDDAPEAMDLDRLTLKEKLALRDLMAKADGQEEVIDVEGHESTVEEHEDAIIIKGSSTEDWSAKVGNTAIDLVSLLRSGRVGV